MAGPIPLLGLLDELRDFANRRNIGQRMVGGGVRGAATRGLLGMDAPENATRAEREVYENAARAAAPVMGLAAAPAAIKTAGRALKDAPRTQALETARQNAVKMLGLPENNTAMDRARAMGFSDDVYHGTNRDVSRVEMSMAGTQTGNPNANLGFFSTPNKAEASRYAKDFGALEGGNVMPLMVRRGEEYPISYKEMNDLAMGLFTAPGNTPRERYLSASKIAKDKRKQLMAEGYDTAVLNKGKTFEEVISLNPANVRSRFAAFDPARINENDLLASLAAMGISIPMILGLLDEERVD